MTKFAVFDAEGFPGAFYSEDVHGQRLIDGEPNTSCLIPADAIKITDTQWSAFLNNPGLRRWQDGHVVPFTPPTPPAPEPGPVLLFPADLWRRTTEEEAEQIEAAMNAQSARLRNLFRTAQTYQSDDPLWPVLEGAAVQLFGEERAAELLAPSGSQR